MKTSDFYYELPQELIAQTPLCQRDHSRLMVLNRESGEIIHRHFYDLVDLLRPGDCLIFNDSRVLPARLYGIKEGTGATVEFLLLNQQNGDCWEVLAGPGKKAKPGSRFTFGNGLMTGEVLDVLEGGNRLVSFSYDAPHSFYEVLDRIGQMPLPPYITQRLKDKERYQTVYSKELGSAAAPTAGLHFTPELMKRLQEKGICLGFVTLHVGLGTFRSVKVDEITEHKMHKEHYEVSEETASLINRTKQAGGRIIAVGTTSCRTLESVMAKEGKMIKSDGWTDIFIYPGYSFQILDGLITNFHLPESTLIMLVSAFAGYEHIMQAYQVAVQERYRFFSFGDAMLLI